VSRNNLRGQRERHVMHVPWERIDVLSPVYRMVGQGLSDDEIAKRLGLSEPAVQDCVSWLCHFSQTNTRAALIQRATGAAQPTWGAP
jgi:DNA-binding NarL/FixJ family response regulator